jgi:hypothetical protein
MPGWLAEALGALSGWPVAAFLRESTIAYAALNAAHIFAIGLVVGSIATLDLRILGLFRQASFAVLAGPLSRVAAAGVLLAIATGFLLFSVRPNAYAQNPAFLAKISLVALGIVNALLLRANRHWPPAGGGARPHLSVRLAALFSLLIWAAAVLAGRWIGFLQ